MGCEILESRRKAKEERERERESESGAHKNPFKRYRWGQQWCLLFSPGCEIMWRLPYLGQVGESGGKERPISFDSLLRFASHAHPSNSCILTIFHVMHIHPPLFSISATYPTNFVLFKAKKTNKVVT